MKQEATIRRATIDDAKVLSQLASRTFYDTFTGTCTAADMQGFLEQYYSEAQLLTELSNPTDLYYLAEMDGIAAGYLRFGANEVPYEHDQRTKSLELNRLYVDRPFHGKGLAHQLMQFYEDYARVNGFDYLWLGVWEHNYRAQAFYKKWGFQFNGETHDFPIGDTPQTDEWWEKRIIGA